MRGVTFNTWSETQYAMKYKLKMGSVKTSFAMQLIQIFLFLILSWVLKKLRPGKYGVELPWNFLFQNKYWTSSAYITKSNIYSKKSNDPSYKKYFVDSLEDLEVAVTVINVQKIFKIARTNIIDLDKVSLNFYKNEITVLIGHNGAGKTTLLSIIAGMLKQSSGNVYVEGFDTVLQQANLKRRIGLCPQHNIFINDFTVQEHLMFFSMINGKNFEKAKKSSQKLMNQLNLFSKASWITSKLPEAMLRRLQIGCALCGNASVLLLDEPTSGLDVESRREIWDILLILRGKRTVIMTTQLLEEADILGDRIIALHAGKLRCNASPSQLKNAFGVGYRVPITTVHRPDVTKITATIRKIAPAAILKDKTLRTLVYYIPRDADMAGIFNTLEYNRTSLDIESMGFGSTSLEEVFMEYALNISFN
ncbi:unnamed protein product [Parnassius apollo]|uniref:(apollo) hypothetical protein n=1 Tax=Parnassius apollo TaxID=110799 RepID=A0A8S3WU63_PARAO|nr:unnamed protein product [Parnassius apollo]